MVVPMAARTAAWLAAPKVVLWVAQRAVLSVA